MRHYWLPLILLLNVQEAHAQSCWQEQAIESELRQQLADLRRTWMQCDPNRGRFSGRDNCFVDLGMAEFLYTKLPQYNESISMESVRQMDASCDTQMEDIYIAQAEAIKAIFGDNMPVKPEKQEPSEEIKQDVITHVIDPCYARLAKLARRTMPNLKETSTDELVEHMKANAEDDTNKMIHAVNESVYSHMSKGQRKAIYKVFRKQCIKGGETLLASQRNN